MSTVSNSHQLAAGAAPLHPLSHELPAAAGGEGEGLGFGDVMRILKQRKLTIVIAALVTYALVVAATLLIWKYLPAYPAQAVFQLDPPQKLRLMDADVSANSTEMQELLLTEASKLKSREMMLDVVADPEVKSTRYFKYWYDGNVEEAIVGLSKDINAAPIPDTKLIRISLDTDVKSEATLIVSTLVRVYKEQFKSRATGESFKRVQAMKELVSRLKDELAAKRTEISNQRKTTDTAMTDTGRTSHGDFISDLMLKITEVEGSIAQLQGQADYLAGLDPSQIPLTAEQKLIIESDPLLRFVRSQVESLDVEIQTARLMLGENHRQFKVLEERRSALMAKEAAKREELTEQIRTRQIESIREALQSQRNILAKFQDQLIQAQAEQRDMERNLLKIKELEDDAAGLQKQIEEVEIQAKEAESASKDDSRAQLQVIENPRDAVKPSRPNFYVYLGGGFAFALMVGVGLAFLREFTDKRIRTPLDVVRYGHISVLGAVPLLDEEEVTVEAIEDVARTAPHSLIAESFRKIRTNIQFSGPLESQRTLLITSPSPEDGKTAVAINLAVTMAHSNQRVLLIDCNFRRPAIRPRFPKSRPDGLSNVLTGQATLEAVVTPTDVQNLSILSTGPMPPRPAELLSSQAMRELLAAALQKYDRVLLDGPPALLISDATVLAMQVDGVILVTRADTNAKGALKRVREQLERINVRIVGAVLNGVRARAGGYFKQQYREFYEYTSDETLPTDLPGLPSSSDDDVFPPEGPKA